MINWPSINTWNKLNWHLITNSMLVFDTFVHVIKDWDTYWTSFLIFFYEAFFLKFCFCFLFCFCFVLLFFFPFFVRSIVRLFVWLNFTFWLLINHYRIVCLIFFSFYRWELSIFCPREISVDGVQFFYIQMLIFGPYNAILFNVYAVKKLQIC